MKKQYKILDKNDIELPRHWSGRYRNYEEATKLIEKLNLEGEYKSYKMIEV